MTAQAPCPYDAMIQELELLEKVLDAEAEALRAMDFAAIDRATADKEAIEARLSSSPRPTVLALPERERLEPLRERIIERARENQMRLRVTLRSVGELLAALTGTEAPGYGRRPPPDSGKAVLTSVVG